MRTIPAGLLNLAGLWLSAGLILVMALINSPAVLSPIAAGLAILGPARAVVAQTRRAMLAPRHLLARVYSVSFLISSSTAPLGSLLAGFLLSWIGPASTATVLATGLALIALAATTSSTIRHADLPQHQPQAQPYHRV